MPSNAIALLFYASTFIALIITLKQKNYYNKDYKRKTFNLIKYLQKL